MAIQAAHLLITKYQPVMLLNFTGGLSKNWGTGNSRSDHLNCKKKHLNYNLNHLRKFLYDHFWLNLFLEETPPTPPNQPPFTQYMLVARQKVYD